MKHNLKNRPKPEHGFETALTYEQELEVFEDQASELFSGFEKELREMLGHHPINETTFFWLIKEILGEEILGDE